MAGSGINLLKRPEEFQPKQPRIANHLLPEHFGRDRRRFVGYQARRGRRGRRHGQLYHLILAQQVPRGNTRAKRADIERLGQLDKLDTRRIGSTQEDGHLQSDPGRAPLLAILQLLAFLGILCSHWDIPVVLAH
jgi:hypothetical protein